MEESGPEAEPGCQAERSTALSSRRYPSADELPRGPRRELLLCCRRTERVSLPDTKGGTCTFQVAKPSVGPSAEGCNVGCVQRADVTLMATIAGADVDRDARWVAPTGWDDLAINPPVRKSMLMPRLKAPVRGYLVSH